MNNKERKILAIMVCVVMFATIFAVVAPVNVDAATIIVPDDYPTIQEAIVY